MARIPGEGLAKGLAVTMRHMLRKSETQQYPEVHPDLPARSRGVIALVEENCTVCMLCARECPDWCIYIDSHKETLPAPEGGRPRARNVLDRFAIDFSLCMYCGICIEVCPFDALFWSPEFEYAEYDIRDLLHEKDRLGEWAATVPPPPAHEVGAEPPKELSAGSRPASAGRTGRPAQVKGPAEGASAAQETAQDTAQETAQETAQAMGQDPAQGTAREIARPAAEPADAPENRPRREPPRAMRDIRSIRPPGSLPRKNGSSPEEKDGPEGER
ncbi:4Fe-4S binding protein [Microbispora sp. NPDC004025]